MRRARAQR
jgi:hypothetical protein